MPLIPTRLLPSSLGNYGQRELISVVIPGTILLIEAWLLRFSPEDVHHAGGYIQLASRQIAHASDWILAVGLFVTVLAAYTLGLLGRMAAWRVFDLIRKGRQPSGVDVTKQFERQHGREAVVLALSSHPALKKALENSEHDPFFQYSKLWLRQNRPRLAVEQHETEINFLVAIHVPLLVAAFVVWRHVGWMSFCIALGVLAFLFVILTKKALARSQNETFDVLRNFLFSQWFGEGPRD